MSTRTISQWICDRSGRFIEEPKDMNAGPDLVITVPWIPALGDLVEVDEGGAARGVAPERAIFRDLSNKDRLTVAKILSRLLKIDEAKIIAAAVARDGHPLTQALELEAWAEVTS